MLMHKFKCKRLFSILSSLRTRPPVVTIMGHVDHGKTTLLDALRKTSVASSEAGGITQHIGAFSVPIFHGNHFNSHSHQSSSTVTFLDTPGHEAFTKIRQRGAQVTDIIVLVIDKNDSIMNQTKECIQLAKKESVPLIVAISKCDDIIANNKNNRIDENEKENENMKIVLNSPQIRRIINDLSQHEIYVESLGGDIQLVPTSAITGFGIPQLLDAIQAQSEILELKADWNAPVDSIIIETRLKEGLGEVSTLIIKQGILKVGTILVSNESICRVKGMLNHKGIRIEEATPSMPVEVIGWRSMPQVGSPAIQVSSEKKAMLMSEESAIKRERKDLQDAQKIIKQRKEIYDKLWQIKLEQEKNTLSIPQNRFTLEEAMIIDNDHHRHHNNSISKREENKMEHSPHNSISKPVVNIILNCDVVGSIEAIQQSINQIPQSKVSIKIVSTHLGPPTDTDLQHAKALQGNNSFPFPLLFPLLISH